MKRKSSYTKEDIIEASSGIMFGKENGKLPKPPMLMVDRISHISDSGGKYKKGKIIAEMNIDPNLFLSVTLKMILLCLAVLG